MTEALPCPWCRDDRTPLIEHEDIVERKITGFDENNGPVYYAACQGCWAQGPLVDWAADAITAWNRRAEKPAAGDEVERVARAICDARWGNAPRDPQDDVYRVLARAAIAAMNLSGSDVRQGPTPTARISGAPDPDSSRTAAAAWTREPPTRQGRYWYWNGSEDDAPIPLYVLWSGTTKSCFIAAGQYSIPPGTACADRDGWWLPVAEPRLPEVECRRTDGRFHGRDMTCEHCVVIP